MTRQLQFPLLVEGVINSAAGARAKSAGMAEAAAHTRPDWAAACDAAIAVMARRGTEFQAADLIKEGLVDEPEHPNQWGSRFRAAAHARVIESAGYARSKRATVHQSLCHQWRGTAAYRAEAAA